MCFFVLAPYAHARCAGPHSLRESGMFVVMRGHHALALPILAASLYAQTYIVDSNNGPGTNYTQISTAVAAVPDGSVLLVRAGAYSTFAISAKSLTVRGEPGVVITPTPFVTNAIAVLNLQPHQAVALQTLTFASASPSPFATTNVMCSNNQGTVHLDNLRCANNNSSVGQIWGTNCSQLLVRGCDNCNAVLESCELGHSPFAPWGAPWAIRQEGGSLQLVNTSVAGGSGGFLEDNAITMVGGDLRLLGNTVITAGAGSGPSFGVGGTGAVRFGTSVLFLGQPAFEPSITATPKSMPDISSSTGAFGADAVLRGPNGGLGAIAIALPGPRVVVPGFADAIWLDSGSLIWVGLGVLGGTTPVSAQWAYTPGSLPQSTVYWQGISYDAIHQMQVSNPSFLVVP